MPNETFDLTGRRVWVAGHRGLVGSALVRRLGSEPIGELVTATSGQLDLRRQAEAERFVAAVRPDVVFLAAARVGGIQANRRAPAAFLYDNLMIAANVIEACRRHAVGKVVVLGSSCIYPRDAPQPIREEYLLGGPLETTNEGYAVAKIAALELARMYRRQYGLDAAALMPTNLYGPNDNFDLATSHVLPALIRKVHDAKITGADAITVWGTGTPRREFLHVDDLADATIFVTRHYRGEEHLNVGVGEDISIRELAQLICQVVGWDGQLVFDTSMPDGTPRKLLDVSKLNALGWKASIGLAEGIESTYGWFVEKLAGSPT
ncbi:MAG TPA: GDP-L-fucose synthase [Nitriliruptorales bacterium]|nr:GDP-L-fucose synthase [Nitriliruptorales bacterium]